jgi:two-component system, OmpR family, sensor kinase
VWIRLGVLAAVVLGAVAGVGFVLASSVTRPVRTLEEGAQDLARGDLSRRVPVDAGPPELQSLAATFNHTADRLQRLIESHRSFVADAAHQLRSPLTALRLRLETIDPDPDSQLAVKIDAAVAEVDRLSRLVDGLLVLARAVETEPATSAIELGPILAKRVEHWRPLCQAKGVVLDLELDAELEPDAVSAGPESVRGLVAQAVPGTIDTALDNLIDNALGLSPEGATIQIRAKRRGGELAVDVIDQGPGMTEGQLARAFDRFWRAPDNKARRGSGLGLAIVADLMAANGGRAELIPSPEGGITARLTVPRA